MKTIVLLSGGLDSSMLLADLMLSEQHKKIRVVEALSFFYGQRHERELLAAREVADAMRVAHTVVMVPGLGAVLRGSSLTDSSVPVPHGHYEAESMKATVVPNRNMMFLAMAAARAIVLGAQAVAYAAHAGDHAIYADCRKDFISAMRSALAWCHEPGVQLMAPYTDKTKAEIISRAFGLLATTQHSELLAKTWSCYEGGPELHCGKCGTCVERREAFEIAAVDDPTRYQV